MIADLGYFALLFAFLAAVYAAGAAWYGRKTENWRWVESARNATLITLPLIALSSALLITLLLNDDFSLDYVWRVSSIEQPTYLKVTALWGGQAGSLLFWNLLLAIFTTAAMSRKWDEQKELMPYALMVASFTQIFFLALSAFVESPFTRVAGGIIPANGNGLNPLLRHPGMIIHPPMLYLGFTGFTIPYTFAMAALLSGKLDDSWIRTTRRWTLVAWLFLSLGLILGGRWAYDVLGWGGYWGWDPVENASLIPWLSGTAFLHSVMIQEKRQMFKWWNISLIVSTYLLVIYGTFIVRSGVISSVHSFAQSAVGPLFFGFIAVMSVFSVYWIIKRREELKSPHTLESFLSREAAFLYNNFLFLAILAIVFLFTNYPIISELFTGERGFVGPPVYEQALAPLFLLLLGLMGVAPLTMWYRTSLQRLGKAMLWPAVVATISIIVLFFMNIRIWPALLGAWTITFSLVLTLVEFGKGTRARMKRGENPFAAFSNLMARSRRRYGGYWIHLGVLVMAYGVIGVELFQQETQQQLQVGDTISLGRYEMQFLGVEQREGPDDLIITEAVVDVYTDGRFVTTLYPRRELYTRTGQPMTIPNARSTFFEDFYVLMAEQPATPNAATLRIFLNPLINWVWAGGLIFVLGTLIAAWPDPVEDKITAVRARRPIAVATGD